MSYLTAKSVSVFTPLIGMVILAVGISACGRTSRFVSSPEKQTTSPGIPSQTIPATLAPLDETSTPTRLSNSPTPKPSWQWLRFDDQSWRIIDESNLELIEDPHCRVWLDRGTDYPHDLTIKEQSIQISGHTWKYWQFINPQGELVAESYSPAFKTFFGWFHIGSPTDNCREHLLALLKTFPWDPNLRPVSPPTQTPIYTMTTQEIATQMKQSTEFYATQGPVWTAQIKTNAAAATATISALTPPAPYLVCPDTVDSRLRVGMDAYVATDTITPNNVRSQASKSTPMIAVIDPGVIITLIGGPKCADGLLWWEVKLANGKTGWTAEGDIDSYWLTPCPTSSVCQPK